VKSIRIGVGSDHGGFDLKGALIKAIKESRKDVELIDFGTNSHESVDYPDMATPVVNALLKAEITHGILICGTGIGICIAANRTPGVRAALVYDLETAKLAKSHNNANILCLGGRTTPLTMAKQIVEKWLATPFEEKEERHARRIQKLG
jgi:ribose 5-phosphate isomerase B